MYQPRPVPDEASPALRDFLQDELAELAYYLNQASDEESLAYFLDSD